jgi:hypothetical protein
LARRDSPDRGARHLNMATTLVHDMPHTLAALESGALSEYRAGLIAAEAADLSRADRRVLDAELCADASTLEGMGNGRITAEAKAIAHRLDDRAATERAAKAAKGRRVTFRPARDAMGYLTVLLPAAQGAALFAELNRTAGAALAAGDNRSRGAVMADTVFERVMGRPAWVADPVAVHLVISDDTLFGDDDSPAVLEGYGPIPAGVARNLVADALSVSSPGPPCAGCTSTPRPGRWWAWNPEADTFPRVWPSSSGCAISDVARPTVTRRFVIWTTLNRATGVDRPARATVAVRANDVTTSRNHRAGTSPPVR